MSEVEGGAAVELGELGLRPGEADLEASNFPGPTFTLGFFDASDEVVADLGRAGPLGGVRTTEH
ncbi:hypothetical protein AB0M57_14010 [Streptomyces sp. NPDC051597]|uniref:hypothetical protein n=1 Tax=Streptomyces sp. NPDC051597 TaxID=3155049 RepID=UPI0034221E84